MLKKLVPVLIVLCAAAPFLMGQADDIDWDTIYRFPRKPGQKARPTRGKVVEESKQILRYTVGGDNVNTMPAEEVQKVIYGASEHKGTKKAGELFSRAFYEYEHGNYEDALEAFDLVRDDIMNDPGIAEWVGAYTRFYMGSAALKLAVQMKKNSAPDVLVKRNYKRAIALFEEFNEKHPTHRLQWDLPLAYAEALIKGDKMDKAVTVLANVDTSSRNPYAQLRKFKAMKLRGDVLKLKGEHEKAISVYEELVRSIPSDNVIDEALRIRQEVSIFIGKVYIEQKKFQMAESYFRKILSDVTQSGVSAGDIGKVYLNLGTCLSHFKKWEEAQWYFLHGCTAYFDDPEVHRGSLLNVIICLDHMVEEGKDEEKKKQYIASLKEYYRQLTNYYGSSKDRIEAQKVYKKYK